MGHSRTERSVRTPVSPTSDRLICSEVPDTAERGAASGRSFEPFVRGDTGHTERERGLERRRGPSATYDRIDRLLLEIAYELVGTPSREDVERTVCERLATSGFYRFAWIGRRAVDGDGVVLRASAGDERGDSAAITADERGMLGGIVGFTLDAIETRRSLFADAVVELEFRLADADAVFRSGLGALRV